MPELVVRTFNGNRHYRVEHDGPGAEPMVGQEVARVPLTSDQANCTIAVLAALYRDGMLQ